MLTALTFNTEIHLPAFYRTATFFKVTILLQLQTEENKEQKEFSFSFFPLQQGGFSLQEKDDEKEDEKMHWENTKAFL